MNKTLISITIRQFYHIEISSVTLTWDQNATTMNCFCESEEQIFGATEVEN